MENLKAVLSNYLIFVIVFALFLVVIIALALYYGSNNSKKSIYLYGLFMDYKTPQIWSLSLFIMHFLLISYSLATKAKLTLALGVICGILVLLGSILNKNIINIIVNILIESVNLAIIYFGSLVDKLRVQAGDNKYLFLQITIMFAGLLFYIFSTFKYIKDIRKKEKIHAKN